MFSWDRDRKMKVFEMKRRKVRVERESEMAELQKAGKYLNPGSIKYLSRKENIEKQVENRLLNFGQLVLAKRKKQESEIMKQIKKLANQNHNKKKYVQQKN